MNTSSILLRGPDAASTCSAPAASFNVEISVSPRRWDRGYLKSNMLNKSLIDKAIPKCPFRTRKEEDFNSSWRTFETKAISVDTGIGRSLKRAVQSPRRSVRGNNTPSRRKVIFQKSNLLLPSPPTLSDKKTHATSLNGLFEAEKPMPEKKKPIELVGKQTLQGIGEHKQYFAELREPRRAVAFTFQPLPDRPRQPIVSKIRDLSLSDLCLHGAAPKDKKFLKHNSNDDSLPNDATVGLSQQERPANDIALQLTVEKEEEDAKAVKVASRSLRRACVGKTSTTCSGRSQKQMVAMIGALEEKLEILDAQIYLLKQMQPSDSKAHPGTSVSSSPAA